MSDAAIRIWRARRAPNQLLRDRTRLPRLRLPHAAARHRLQVPGLRRGPRHRLRLRAAKALIAERGLADRP